MINIYYLMINWLDNLYIINTILNFCSTTFTLLFILYRFTSLFSYIIGFIKFCGKLFNGVVYLKKLSVDYYYNKLGQINEDIEYGLDEAVLELTDITLLEVADDDEGAVDEGPDIIALPLCSWSSAISCKSVVEIFQV